MVLSDRLKAHGALKINLNSVDHGLCHCSLAFLSGKSGGIYNLPVTTPALLVLSVLIFVMLLQLNGLVALLFLLTAIIFIPALIIQRREMAMAPDLGPGHDAESHARGLLRLAQAVGADTTGIALGVLWLIFTGVLALFLSRVVFH